MRRILISVLSIAFLFTSAASFSDTIYLLSGDRISGTIKTADEEKMVVSTEYGGDISIKRAFIKSFETEKTVTVILDDDQRFSGQVHSSDQNHIEVRSSTSETAETIPIQKINIIYAGDLEAYEAERQKTKYSGQFNLGYNRAKGNSDFDNKQLDAQLKARTLKNRYTLYAEAENRKQDGEQSADNWLGSLQHDHFFNDKLYFFSSGTFESDQLADLDLRSTLAIGLGYQFWEEKKRNLSFELGTGYTNEKFDDSEDNDFAIGRWSVNFDYLLFDAITFFHFNEGLQNLSESDDLIIRSRTGFRFVINDYVQTTLQRNWDWDQDPAPGTTSTDRETIISIGVKY